MPRLLVNEFDGLSPRTEAHALADNQAQVAQNTKLYARELRPWRSALVEGTAPLALVQTIYKLYNYAGAFQWLQWTTDVDVALSPQADTGDIRFFYTGAGTPKKSNYALIAGATSYDMGVPAPIAAPTLTPTVGGSGSAQTRAYIYTFVNAFGVVEEESAPSPPTTITINAISPTVTVSLMDTSPGGYTGNITKRRIYRSVTGTNTTSYQFVAEIPIAQATYADTLTSAQLGAVLDTLGWRPPPTTLTGIVNLGSGTGVLAGFTGNTVCFSEPFFPHAWPTAYQLNLPFKIIGLGVVGSSLIVMTDRYPFIISGGVPGGMSVERVPLLEPCVSKKSIVSVEDGVVYASPNGLITIGAGGRGNTVRALYRRDEWQALQPENMIGAVLDGRYIGAFNTGAMAGKAILLDAGDRPALCQLDLSGPMALHVDSKDAKLYYVNSGRTSILQLDAGAGLLSYTWRSKVWDMPTETSWSAARMRADYTTGAASVACYADGVLVATLTPTDGKPFRLPAFRAREFYFEITGTRKVRSIAFGTSMSELVG